ncbi:MAG TPA: GIY-YIG nuclease family protein [Jatrophihabitans sp.]|jgi:hypothetical protein|uniref:GIY-YIG nuclease family protein n=1 Tax=Jatrophihabitans sp. TaxID=1932789 RepID=UPI002F099B6D
MEPIPLSSLLGSAVDPAQCKLHCAVFNGEHYPIDVLSNDPHEWEKWNRWRGPRNDFNRQFIFSLAQDRHDPNLWLFGGVFEVLVRRGTPGEHSYDITLREDMMGPFIRRLFIHLALTGRQVRRAMEGCIDAMTVASILPEPHVGDPFPGHDRINHSLAEIQLIVSQNRPDWRIALENMKGVYVIHDRLTGEPYVGSAYGDTGIWQRWARYAESLHGNNVGLRALVDGRGVDYVRQNLMFALLEFWSMRTEDQHVLDRETYWKGVLLSRSFGHNKN